MACGMKTRSRRNRMIGPAALPLPLRLPATPARATDEALSELLEAGRVHSTAVVLFHTTLAAHSGLSPIESKALEIIQRLGPLIPNPGAWSSFVRRPRRTGGPHGRGR